MRFKSQPRAGAIISSTPINLGRYPKSPPGLRHYGLGWLLYGLSGLEWLRMGLLALIWLIFPRVKMAFLSFPFVFPRFLPRSFFIKCLWYLAYDCDCIHFYFSKYSLSSESFNSPLNSVLHGNPILETRHLPHLPLPLHLPHLNIHSDNITAHTADSRPSRHSTTLVRHQPGIPPFCSRSTPGFSPIHTFAEPIPQI
jgi:hypothetical protein